MPETPTKRAHEARVQWESIKYGKFVAGWSPPELLGTITRYVWRHFDMSWRKSDLFDFYTVMNVYEACFFFLTLPNPAVGVLSYRAFYVHF